MANWTKGPWEARLERRSWAGGRAPVVTAGGKRLAVVEGEETLYTPDGNDRDEAAEAARDDANARLIAASPDLLALVEGIAELTDGTFSELDILENLSRMGEEARTLPGKI